MENTEIGADMAAPKPVFLRTPYNYDMMAASNETGLSCPEPTLTQQQFKDEADINTIVERFHITGHIPENVRQPTYGDFTGIKDYQSALHALSQADEAFMEMPAEVRFRFNNDPGEFVEFCSNPANKDEWAKLGLTKTPTQPTSQPAPLTNPSSTPPTGSTSTTPPGA